MPDDSAHTSHDDHAALFVTTRWSLVLSARDKVSPDSERALESLCRAYWYPLYVFVRRRGHQPHDAQDFTQAFFARLLEKDFLNAVSQEKGRFRTFLVVALKRFLLNEWDKVRTQKRGGGQQLLPLDGENAEYRYQAEHADALSAEAMFERRWALTLLEQAMTRLRTSYAETRREAEFEHLKGSLTADRGEVDYAQIARALGMSEGAARVALHRLRKRFREFFREEIAGTVSDPADVDDEVRHVVALISRG